MPIRAGMPSKARRHQVRTCCGPRPGPVVAGQAVGKRGRGRIPGCAKAIAQVCLSQCPALVIPGHCRRLSCYQDSSVIAQR